LTGRPGYSPFAERDDPEYVCPLLSQPLLELCLQIPVYIHTAAGWDRALERRAFMDVLPSKIVQRRRKGSIGVAMNALLQTNLSLVRELMLEGLLIENQLLDRRKVEAALTGSNVTLSPMAAEIIGEHLSTEVWLQRWNSPSLA
jgi:asparagine synthase (glutamine-hydrolysing)